MLKNENGQGLIEYLIVVALIAVATIAVTRVLGQAVQSRFASIAHALQGEKKQITVRVDASVYKRKDLGNFLDGVEGKQEGRERDSAD